MNSVFNFSRRKVGGIWFVKLGRFTLSFSLSRAYRPIGAAMPFTIGELQAACRRASYEGGNEIIMEVSNDRR